MGPLTLLMAFSLLLSCLIMHVPISPASIITLLQKCCSIHKMMSDRYKGTKEAQDVDTHSVPYLSSSSSMYPLLSWSRTVNTFFLSASDDPVSPTCAKKDLKSNVPGASQAERSETEGVQMWEWEVSQREQWGIEEKSHTFTHNLLRRLPFFIRWHLTTYTL